MGEEADALHDAEMTHWELHTFGECDDHCVHCYVDEQDHKRLLAEMDVVEEGDDGHQS